MSYNAKEHEDREHERTTRPVPGSSYIDYVDQVAKDDVAGLKKAQESYGDSWKRRGGVGAFMMLARKWDRLENQVSRGVLGAVPYNIFQHVQVDQRSEGILDDIRDLRRYLMLVEAEIRAHGINPGHRDNGTVPQRGAVANPSFQTLPYIKPPIEGYENGRS